jgi:metal-dependent amidase/aminoacylase/carboxypeptidase family protein
VGVVYCKQGPFALASAGIRVSVCGTKSHASQPHLGRSPIPILSQLALLLPGLPSYLLPCDAASTVTVTYLNAGEPCYGIAAGTGELRAVLRADSDEGSV